MFVDKSQFTVLKVRPCVVSLSLSLSLNAYACPCSSLAFLFRMQLYRDCLRLADYISTRGGLASSRIVLRAQVRDAFKKNKDEQDPAEIEKQKDAAIRGLSNYMFYEAQRMAKEEGGEAGEGGAGEMEG